MTRWRAGFEKVIFIIKRENEQAFREAIGDRLSRFIQYLMYFRNWIISRRDSRFRKDG